MEVRENVMVTLGYGKYFRSDRIIGLEPIEENRGPRRRTRVYVEGQESPIIASRTEATILRDMVEVPEEVMEARAAFEVLRDILEDLRDIGPMLRRSIREEAQLDLDEMEKHIRALFSSATSEGELRD
jgi:predicted DNA-binding transcriptional regulator YafY